MEGRWTNLGAVLSFPRLGRSGRLWGASTQRRLWELFGIRSLTVDGAVCRIRAGKKMNELCNKTKMQWHG